MFQAVDLAFHRAVLLAQRHPLLVAPAFQLRHVLLAAFGHH
jgi:hypothetical protein